jgi:hypothetical protein
MEWKRDFIFLLHQLGQFWLARLSEPLIVPFPVSTRSLLPTDTFPACLAWELIY